MKPESILGRWSSGLAFAGLAAACAPAFALSNNAYGPAVDAFCTTFNGTKPFAAQGCAMCHNSSFSTPKQPAWDNYHAGNFAPFCGAAPAPNQAPNGTISLPAANVSVVQGASVSFTATGSDPDGNTPLTYAWNFGGGAANSTLQNPSAVFNTPGTYTVGLTVTDAKGLADPTPATRTVTVTASTPTPNQAPNGTIASPTSALIVAQGAVVNFAASGSDPDGNTPLAYAWDFAGGAANTTAQNPSVTFNTAGTFAVKLSVSDAKGLVDPTPATVSVTVTAAANQAPVGNIVSPGSDLSLIKGATVSFQGSASDPDGNTPLSYLWNFGGAAADSTLANPAVTFNTVGTYAVSLTVKDAKGLADPTPVVRTIAVREALPAQCTDRDRDGYAAEGGICGPRDCNDNNAAINPGVPERCGDGVDNDCDGKIDRADTECGSDCVGNLFFKPIDIERAEWDQEERRLRVEGEHAPRGSTVKLYAVASGALLASSVVESDGDWEFELSGLAVVPCRVRVEINGVKAERAVANAPTTCDKTATPPVASADAYGVDAGKVLTVAAPGVLGNDSSPSGKPLSATRVTTVAHGNLTLNADGSFSYTPASGYVGADSFTYRAGDGVSTSTAATVSITVKQPNLAPSGSISAPTRNLTVRRGTSVSFRASGSDPDGNSPLSYRWNFGGGATNVTAQNPTVTFSTAGTFVVKLTVVDSKGLADPTPATRTVTVTASTESDD